MIKLPRWSVVTLTVVMLVVGIFLQSDDRSTSATSYGEAPWGFGALFDLLNELGLDVRRNLQAPSSLPPTTLWLIEPGHLCRSGPAGSDADAAAIDELLMRGGTAVIFLSSSSVRGRSCGRVGAADIPEMEVLDCKRIRDGDRCQIETAAAANQRNRFKLEGLGPVRRLRAEALRRFKPSTDWSTIASVEGSPFVVERSVGAGRAVLVADSRFLRNRWLDQADAAVVAADLAQRYGTPRIDEWSHGYREHASLLLYLVKSASLPFLVGLVLSGLTLAAYGAVVPIRSAPASSPAPSLSEAVDTLASAYAATADYPELHRRYREYVCARLRHHLGLPPQTTTDGLREHLNRRHLGTERADVLSDIASARSHEDLMKAARTLDQLLLEATG